MFGRLRIANTYVIQKDRWSGKNLETISAENLASATEIAKKKYGEGVFVLPSNRTVNKKSSR